MKITVIGAGYVGLVTGACLADLGNDVFCVDVNARTIGILNNGDVPIYEPRLKEIVSRNREAGRLTFSTDIEASVHHGDIQFIAVGTPPDEDGSADLRHVLDAASNIGRFMVERKIIVDKSTVPVGTGDKVRRAVQQALEARGKSIDFGIVSNPEFLKEGAAVDDFMRPDRIVIGVDDPGLVETMQALYAPFQRNHERMIVMDVRSAELTKYAANAMLATRISFMNELANLAEKIGADIEHVRRGIGSDSRIGYHFLYAGCGYGGSCFPKDVEALQKTARNDTGIELRVLNAVEQANSNQKQVLHRKIRERFGGDLLGRKIAVWGLAFKPNTDDMREAPSRHLILKLLADGAIVSAYDPVAMQEAARAFGESENLSYAATAVDAVAGADALVVVTEWKEFKSPDFDLLVRKLKFPIIFDGRNLYDPRQLEHMGIEYFGIGRGRPI